MERKNKMQEPETSQNDSINMDSIIIESMVRIKAFENILLAKKIISVEELEGSYSQVEKEMLQSIEQKIQTIENKEES